MTATIEELGTQCGDRGACPCCGGTKGFLIQVTTVKNHQCKWNNTLMCATINNWKYENTVTCLECGEVSESTMPGSKG